MGCMAGRTTNPLTRRVWYSPRVHERLLERARETARCILLVWRDNKWANRRGAERLVARSDTTGDLKRTSQIGFLSLKRKPLLRRPQAKASQWGRELSSLLAWPGYKIGHPLSDGRADLLPRPYPLAILPNGVLRRCQDRLHNLPKVSCTFGPDVCCTCALLQAKARQNGYYARLGT